ncbi:MAG TPA: P-loop NTPase [Chloroflexota bacterium]|jgi:pilus assembly protein CpaE
MNPISAPSILLFAVDPSLAPLGRALQALGFEVLRATSEEEGRQFLASRRGLCLAVLDTTRGGTYSADAVARLLSQEPAVPTLMLLGGDRAQAARLLGDGPACFDYAKLPAPVEQLVLRVQALCVGASLGLPDGSTEQGERPLGTMVVMFGAKGGIGRSMIAANLAVGLAQQYGHRVALVDADLWYSAQRVLLNLDSDKNIASLTRLENPLDPDALRDILVPHSTGVQVMLAPEEPWLVETIPADLPAGVARAYQREFDFVIVDTHPSTEEYVLQLLDAADRILLVTTPEVGPLRRTLEMLKLAPGLGWREKLLLVLNRADSGVWRDHIETTLDMRVDATIVGNGRLAVAAANEGVPLLMLDPTGKEQITRDVRRLVSCVAGEPETGWEAAPPRRSWWQFWRGSRSAAPAAAPLHSQGQAPRPHMPIDSALALAEAEAARRLLHDGAAAASGTADAADLPADATVPAAPQESPAAAGSTGGQAATVEAEPVAAIDDATVDEQESAASATATVAAAPESAPGAPAAEAHRRGLKRQRGAFAPTTDGRRRRSGITGPGKVRPARSSGMLDTAAVAEVKIEPRPESDSADEARDHAELAEAIALLIQPDCVAPPHGLDGEPEGDTPPAGAADVEACDDGQAESAPPPGATAPTTSDDEPDAAMRSEDVATAGDPNDEPDTGVAPKERAASQAA